MKGRLGEAGVKILRKYTLIREVQRDHVDVCNRRCGVQ